MSVVECSWVKEYADWRLELCLLDGTVISQWHVPKGTGLSLFFPLGREPQGLLQWVVDGQPRPETFTADQGVFFYES